LYIIYKIIFLFFVGDFIPDVNNISVTPGHPTSRGKRAALQSGIFISTAAPQLSQYFAADTVFQWINLPRSDQ
jgi:hypothetical protein